jgi:octaprenyl-diphosphate synthase
VGDFLFSRAFTLMVDAGSLDILAVLARASNVIAEGEVLQLAAQCNASTTQEHYMAVIRAKTAALFAAATRIGGMLAGVATSQAEALENFGMHTGIAFQIADDVLDYIGAPDQSGKAVGNDLAQGKMTLPVILAFRQGDASEQTFWKQLVESPADSLSEAALHRALALLEKHDTLNAALHTATSHAEKAAECLSSFPASAWKEALLGMLDFVVRRSV